MTVCSTRSSTFCLAGGLGKGLCFGFNCKNDSWITELFLVHVAYFFPFLPIAEEEKRLFCFFLHDVSYEAVMSY